MASIVWCKILPLWIDSPLITYHDIFHTLWWRVLGLSLLFSLNFSRFNLKLRNKLRKLRLATKIFIRLRHFRAKKQDFGENHLIFWQALEKETSPPTSRKTDWSRTHMTGKLSDQVKLYMLSIFSPINNSYFRFRCRSRPVVDVRAELTVDVEGIRLKNRHHRLSSGTLVSGYVKNV